ncbi:MAG TPA: GrpB family protein [Bryobacteraceae bacterium]|jgi:GrpB-like predicted nucleotidyltransferase (UPF0157 family)|nr:GrpB family protein [Bryobacteraceae bacterium]
MATNARTGIVTIADYDPAWQTVFEKDAVCIREALGPRALRIEHCGSTSVPGLPAKPVIDIVLAVADSADEAAYLPSLESAGYALRLREPEWFEHRLLNRRAENPGVALNMHVFSQGCTEIDRMLAFRDWLRANATDRELYARIKRDLAGREWKTVQDYADAKSPVVAEIMTRATAPHD